MYTREMQIDRNKALDQVLRFAQCNEHDRKSGSDVYGLEQDVEITLRNGISYSGKVRFIDEYWVGLDNSEWSTNVDSQNLIDKSEIINVQFYDPARDTSL